MSAASRDDTMQDRLLEAILPHVAFDGWSEASFQAACRDCDLSSREARLHCARGALDLAILFHENGDKSMRAMLAASDLSEMRFRDKVAHAVKYAWVNCRTKRLCAAGQLSLRFRRTQPLGQDCCGGRLMRFGRLSATHHGM